MDRYKVITAGISALILTTGIARFAYTPLLPVMREQAGLSAVASGWLATVNYAGYIVGALVAANISDLGRKFHLYRVGLVLGVVSTAAMGMTQNVNLWLMLRFVSGLSSTAGILIGSGLVLNWLIRNHQRPELGLHFSGVGLGIIVSGLAVAAMVRHLSWSTQWLGLGALSIAFFVPAWAWLPKPAAVVAYGEIPAVRVPARRWMMLFLAAYFCAGFGYVVSATFIVAIVEKMPLMAGRADWVWVIVGVAGVPSCFLWDRVSATLGDVPALLVAYALQIVSVLLPAVSDGTAGNLVSAALYGNTFVGIVGLTLSMIGRRFPANPAKAMARLTLSYGAAQIVAPAMAGYIADATGSYRGALVVAAGVLALGMGLLLAMKHAGT